jgi:transcriptional regulator with XRE-family HTH domain
MDNLTLVAARIAERLAAVGLTERKASMLATGQPDAIRYIRTRGTMPSAVRMMKIATVLKATPDYLFGDTETNEWDANEKVISLAARFSEEAANERNLPGRHIPISGSKAFSDEETADLVVYGFTKDILGFAAGPIGMENEPMGAFYPADSTMAPVFEPSTPVVFVHKKEADVGDHALIFLRGIVDGKTVKGDTFILRKIVDRTDEWLTVQQHTPSRMARIPSDMVDHSIRALVLRDYIMPSPRS